MSEIELEPCPFCGGKAAMQDAYLAGIMGNEPDVYCGNCSFSLPPERWNTRSQSERVSRLEEALKPFADAADEIERDYGTGLPDQQYQFPPVTMADFRRARSALNQGADDGRD